MILFSEFLIEADKKGYIEFEKNAEIIHKFVETRKSYNRPLMGKLINGESLKPIFKEYDKCAKIMQNFIDSINNNDLVSFKVAAEAGKYELKHYETLKANYEKLEEMYYQIFNVVKVGDNIKIAVKKLYKLSNSLKYFNIFSGQYENLYFNKTSEEELLKKAVTGQCILKGINNLIITFKNNKVIKIGF